jgi:putative membrane protein
VPALAIALPPARFPAWHAHPDVWALIGVLGAGYAWLAREEPPSRRQAVAYACGLLTLLVASDWPVHDLAERFLYSIHMVQHLLYTLVAAPLLLLGIPAPTMSRLLGHGAFRRVVRAVCRPVAALVIYNVVLVFSHWPAWVDITLRHHPVHLVAHVILVVAALITWMPVVSPLDDVPQLDPFPKMLYLFLESIVPTVPASFLTFGSAPLYHFYEHVPRLWRWSALGDQQTAGLIMKIGGSFYLWSIIAVVFFRWYHREEGGGDVLHWDQVEKELQRAT